MTAITDIQRDRQSFAAMRVRSITITHNGSPLSWDGYDFEPSAARQFLRIDPNAGTFSILNAEFNRLA